MKALSLAPPLALATGPQFVSQTNTANAVADDSAIYLTKQICGSGLFVYERDAAHPEWQGNSYNLLRHSGCLYALIQHHTSTHRGDLDQRIVLAGLRILDWLRPLPNLAGTLAAWSQPDINDTVSCEQVKLGGSALSLLALTELNTIRPNSVDVDVLSRLASGLMAMQRSDGFFISKLVPSQGGFQKNWTSLFYPGEAALALLRLARQQPPDAQRYQQAAKLALLHLATIRKHSAAADIPLDHWALIATAELLSQRPQHDDVKTTLMAHARQVVQAMLARQLHDYAIPQLHGSFARNGSTTTTATCMEGLLAIRPWLAGDLPLAASVDQACDLGFSYLVKTQLRHGYWCGAIPSMAAPNPSIIRIDYVQHALSAFVGMAERPLCANTRQESSATKPSLICPPNGVLTTEICREALDLGLHFMLARVGSDGAVTYEVPLQPGPAETSRHQVREAGGIWGLSLYLHRQQLSDDQRQSIWDALTRAVRLLEQTSVSATGFRRPMPADEAKGALGTAALWGLALVEMLAQNDCPNRQERQRLLQELLAFILACRQSSGRYHSSYDLNTGRSFEDPSPYFDGEVVLLLAKAARVLGHTAYAVPASTGADAMFEAYARDALERRQLSDLCKGFYQWGSMAMHELHQMEPREQRWADRVIAMADWILDVHQVLGRKRNTGYAFEGLISAFALAKARGDQQTMRRLRGAIESGLSRLCTWQLGASLQTQALQQLYPHNPDAIGGVIGGRKDTCIRIDTVQHQMHALMLAERHLEL